MKHTITLQTTIAEALAILNDAVKPLWGKKFEGGYDGFHNMVAEAVAGIELPEGLEYSVWRITHDYEGVFEYTKDITEDQRYKDSFVKRGTINSIAFEVAHRYYDHQSSNTKDEKYVAYYKHEDTWTVEQLINAQKLLREEVSLKHQQESIAEEHEEMIQRYRWLFETQTKIAELQKVVPQECINPFDL